MGKHKGMRRQHACVMQSRARLYLGAASHRIIVERGIGWLQCELQSHSGLFDALIFARRVCPIAQHSEDIRTGSCASPHPKQPL